MKTIFSFDLFEAAQYKNMENRKFRYAPHAVKHNWTASPP